MTAIEAIEARLPAPGGPFGTAVEPVLGEPMRVFRERPRSLRALLEGRAALAGALRAWCAARLACFEVPAHRALRDEPLPRNATGKVMKHVRTRGAVSPFVDE